MHSKVWNISWHMFGVGRYCVLFPCFLSMGNVVQTGKWLIVSLPLVSSLTSNLPQSAFITFLLSDLFLRNSCQFRLLIFLPFLLLFVFLYQSKLLIPSFCSWLIHLRWRLGSWRRRWLRHLHLWTRSPWTFKGIAAFCLFFTQSKPLVSQTDSVFYL